MYFWYIALCSLICVGQGMNNTGKLVEYLMNEGSGTTLTNNYCGNLVMGDCYNLALDSAAGWSSQWYDFGQGAGTHRATVTGSNAISLSQATMYAVVKWNRRPVLAGYAPIFGTNASEVAMFGMSNFTATSGAGSPEFRLNSAAQYSPSSNISDGAWHCVAGTYDGTAEAVYVDGVPVRSLVATISSTSTSTLAMSYFSSAAYWPGLIAYTALYNAGHSAATIKTNCQSNIAPWAWSVKGISIPSPTRIIVCEGDSITDQTTAPPPSHCAYAAKSINPTTQANDVATSGASVATMVTREAATASVLNSVTGTRVLTVLIGANDLQGSTAATFVAALKSYCNDMKGLVSGLKIVIDLVLPQTGVGFNAKRNSANTLILADPSFWDYVVRTDQDTVIGCDACAADTTYYSDGEHLTAAGQNQLGRDDILVLQTAFGGISSSQLSGSTSLSGQVSIQ